ncbi:hypothetical protein LUZ63_003614 [Rhynchospora breviuscula]|uniref:RING-type E3 ubiquitin transferase n=1 Tax=Rhynchospora breviuscula TaxID=2022672 RepID=A0A9Q0D1N6_9POAL|nr:hypothetical protein LUZ63_003614 [Rhynchospora breviuscula]
MDGGNHITTVKLDTNWFKCPICYEAFSPPIFQCAVGHAICSSCYVKLPRNCAFCSLPIVYTRAITLEKIIESAAFPCPNSEYGCPQYLSFSQLQQHKDYCIYSSHCFCPKQGCSFKGSTEKLVLHLLEHYNGKIHGVAHNTELFFKFFPTDDLKILLGDNFFKFLIIKKNTALGWAFSVVCLRRPRSTEREFWYKLSLVNDGGFPFSVETKMENTTLENGFPTDKHFLIPSELCSNGYVEIRLWISDKH